MGCVHFVPISSAFRLIPVHVSVSHPRRMFRVGSSSLAERGSALSRASPSLSGAVRRSGRVSKIPPGGGWSKDGAPLDRPKPFRLVSFQVSPSPPAACWTPSLTAAGQGTKLSASPVSPARLAHAHDPRPEAEPVDGGGHVRGHYSSIAPPISLRCLRNVKDGSATRLVKY